MIVAGLRPKRLQGSLARLGPGFFVSCLAPPLLFEPLVCVGEASKVLFCWLLRWDALIVGRSHCDHRNEKRLVEDSGAQAPHALWAPFPVSGEGSVCLFQDVRIPDKWLLRFVAPQVRWLKSERGENQQVRFDSDPQSPVPSHRRPQQRLPGSCSGTVHGATTFAIYIPPPRPSRTFPVPTTSAPLPGLGNPTGACPRGSARRGGVHQGTSARRAEARSARRSIQRRVREAEKTAVRIMAMATQQYPRALRKYRDLARSKLDLADQI